MCARLRVECRGVVREAIEQKVVGKWRVGGFTDGACMWSFRTGELK